MIQNEQILEYIDGLLGPDAEQALFDAMARQPELRSALRQFISIGDAVRSDREAYTPPSDVERALMNDLGLGNLAPYAGAPAVSGAIARLSSFGGRFWGMMMSFLLGALLAGSTVVYVMSDRADDRIAAERSAPSATGDAAPGDAAPGGAAPGDAESEGKSADSRAPGVVPQSGGGMADASPVADDAVRMNATAINGNREGGTGLASSSSRRNGERPAGQRLGSSRSGSGTYHSDGALGGGSDNRRQGGGGPLDASGSAIVSQPPALADTPSGASGSGMASRPDVTPVQPRNMGRRAEIPRDNVMEDMPARVPQEPVDLVPEPDGAGDRTRSITLEARLNLGGAYNPNNALRSPSPTDDLMGSLLFHPSNSFALGLEIGKESYDQTLYSVSTDTLQVEQRPSYLWFGATGRLYLGELPFNGIETFVQGTAAYSTGGPVMRLRLGGRMPLAPAWDVTFGVETAGLIYTFQDRQSVSGRWGITGGVQWMIW